MNTRHYFHRSMKCHISSGEVETFSNPKVLDFESDPHTKASHANPKF